MIRAVGWLCVVALGIAAHVYDSDALRGACTVAIFVLLAITAPAPIRPALVAVGVGALAILIAFGPGSLFDALPALICAFVGYLFARTLFRGRRPLIARAISSIDGETWLDRPEVARYARTLTVVWAVYQLLLAVLAALAACHASALPGPRVFGALLPIAVAALFIVEFAARPLLLPDVPRHGLISFARRLILAWPDLLDDRAHREQPTPT